MRATWQALTFALLLSSLGCGGDDTVPIAPSNGQHNDRKDAGDSDASDDDRNRLDASAGASDAGNDAGDDLPAIDPRAPVVEFLAPAAAKDSNKDTLITTRTVEVQCQVTRSEHADSHAVDQSTVRIEAHFLANPDRPDKVTVITSAVDAKEDNVYAAEFNLAVVPNGAIEFACSANDTGAPAIQGHATMQTLVDLGPKVEILSPEEGETRALKTPVQVKFRIAAALVDEDDKEDKPKNVTLMVSGQKTAFEEDKKDRGTYTATINFDDTTIFPMAPSTAQIVVTAASSRTPDAPTREAVTNIVLDSEPPSITVQSPKTGALVRGEVVLSVKIVDPAGIKPNSVIATINNGLHVIEDWKVVGNVYSARFDTLAFGKNLTQLTTVIKASDNVGNLAENRGELSHILYLDNLPPRLSLDPPAVRDSFERSNKTYCSTRFDPLGDDATSEGQTVSVSSLYRVMIIDESNYSDNANDRHLALVDNKTTVLFAQGDPSIPLLIDTNDDGICDEIAATDVQRVLKPLTPRGTAYYPPADQVMFTGPEQAAPFSCNPDSNTEEPPSLCVGGTLLSRVISMPVGSQNQPVIYASGETLNSGPVACEGETWELIPSLGEGWACLAARAEDTLGNVGVSPPLHVCFDSTLNGPNPCNPADMPTCVDNCTPPDNFPQGMIFGKR
jgi:hypothetical protein